MDSSRCHGCAGTRRPLESSSAGPRLSYLHKRRRAPRQGASPLCSCPRPSVRSTNQISPLLRRILMPHRPNTSPLPLLQLGLKRRLLFFCGGEEELLYPVDAPDDLLARVEGLHPLHRPVRLLRRLVHLVGQIAVGRPDLKQGWAFVEEADELGNRISFSRR